MLTIEKMERLSNESRLWSRVREVGINNYAIDFLEKSLSKLKDEGKVRKGETVKYGIDNLEYDTEVSYIKKTSQLIGTFHIKKTGRLFPVESNIKAWISEMSKEKNPRDLRKFMSIPAFGAMAGVLINLISEDDYLMQLRGQKSETAVGQLQTSAAGFTEANETIKQSAIRELKEEADRLKLKPKLFKEHEYGRILDMTPFMSHGYPQPLFSYVATIDSLDDYPLVMDLPELEEFREKLGKDRKREANHFKIPLNRLSKFNQEVHHSKKENYYGDCYTVINHLIEWLETKPKI